MNYSVEKATTWDQIKLASVVDNRCISEGRANFPKAEQTWDVFSKSDDVIYFLLKGKDYHTSLIGYVRLLCVSSVTGLHRTWIADYISPSLYEPIILAAREVSGSILVKTFGCNDDLLVKDWPVFSSTFPKLEKYPYHQTPIAESTWMVVKK